MSPLDIGGVFCSAILSSVTVLLLWGSWKPRRRDQIVDEASFKKRQLQTILSDPALQYREGAEVSGGTEKVRAQANTSAIDRDARELV